MKRDRAIDLLKFLAVLLVVNSHLDICYPSQYRFLATGGSLGDALFFFCSGFTLFLGRDGGFVAWYKRRLARILPSVIVCVLAFSCYYGKAWWAQTSGYWFVRCILIYYVLLYGIRRFLSARLWVPVLAMAIICIVWWVMFEDPHNSVYAGSYFMWCHYFLPMLMGALAGLYREKMRARLIVDAIAFGVCIVAYFATWKYALRHVGYEWLQLVSIPLLSASVVCLYKLAICPYGERVMAGTAGKVLTGVGALCLEVYLSHRILIMSNWNALFPMNIILIFIGVVLVAYLVRCVSRLLVQTMNGADGYDWCEIIRI